MDNKDRGCGLGSKRKQQNGRDQPDAGDAAQQPTAYDIRIQTAHLLAPPDAHRSP
jgi:hypothetical protein